MQKSPSPPGSLSTYNPSMLGLLMVFSSPSFCRFIPAHHHDGLQPTQLGVV